MLQFGGVIRDILIFGNISNLATKGVDTARNLGKDFLDKKIDKFNKEYITGKSSRITLTNSEIKHITKVIKSLQNREVLLKGTTKKTISQEGGFPNFLRPLMTAGLPLMKNVLTPLSKSVLVPVGLTAAASATDAAIQKKVFGSGTTLVFPNEKISDIIKIVNSFEDVGLLIKVVSETVS